jgi:chromosome segregation protein
VQIKRLRLSGFKSFVDPADLRIEPGLTGVVGPNGCGKSNLLEALRWTMGETSARSMRGAGMEDVIFAGTSTRPPRDFAEVSMLTEIDGTETEIVRRIERGAGSAYRIDGRDVRAKDVSLLFADAATGAHSPALVSQGRISAVIAAKPAERRAMLEEAAGIAGLHVRRRDAEARLRATEANLARLDELISDQDTRVASLRRQARQAERYRVISDQIRIAEARMIFARWRDAQAASDAAKAEAAACEDRVTAATEAQRAAAASSAAATQTVAQARAAAQAARDAVSEAGHALAGLRANHGAVLRRIGELADSTARLATDRSREGALASDAAEAIARLAQEAKTLEARLADATARLPELGGALAQGLAAQASEIADVRVADAALAAARARLDRAARDLARITGEANGLADAAPLHAERTRAGEMRAQALRHAEAARAALAAADATERAAIGGRDHAQSGRSAAHADLAALDSEAAALTRATRRSAEGRDRLLDHVRPDPGYERALAAALGDDLEAGLDPAAERHWAGATVQPDDPLAPPATTALIGHVAAPKALARRLAQVFVTDTDAGAPLAAGQRVVTLAGVLRRWDGYVARSCGAAAAERLERLNRLRAIEGVRPDLVRAVDSADAELRRIDAVIGEARRAAADARRLLDSAEATAREAGRAEDRAAAALERLDAQRADLAARTDRVRGEHAEAAAELDRATATRAALPDGSETRARVAALSADADARRTAIAAVRAERAGLDRAIGEAHERLAAGVAEAKGWRSRAGLTVTCLGGGDLCGEHGGAIGERSGLSREIESPSVHLGNALGRLARA